MNTPAADIRPVTMTVQQAADLLGLSRSAAYRAVAAGQLPAIRLGRRLLVPIARLEALLGGSDRPPGTVPARIGR